MDTETKNVNAELLEQFSKKMEEKFELLMKESGLSSPESRAAVSAIGAKLLNPAMLDKSVAENVYNGDDRAFAEECVLGDFIAMNLAKTAPGAGVIAPNADEWFKGFREALDKGAFVRSKSVQAIIKKNKLNLKSIDTVYAAVIATATMSDFISRRYLISPLRNYATIVPMGQAIVRWPRQAGDFPTPVDHAKGAVETPDEIAMDNVTLTTCELMAGIKIPNETLRDAVGNLMEFIIMAIGTQMRRTADRRYATGSGVAGTQPMGLSTFGSFTKAITAIGNLQYDDFIDALNTLGDEWTQNPDVDGLVWIMNQAMKGICMKVKDADNRPIFLRLQTTAATAPGTGSQNFTPAGAQWEMLGIPAIVLPGLPGAGTVSSPYEMYLAAAKPGIYMGDRANLEIRGFDQTYATSNSTYIRGTMGYDMQIAQPDAVCKMTGITG